MSTTTNDDNIYDVEAIVGHRHEKRRIPPDKVGRLSDRKKLMGAGIEFIYMFFAACKGILQGSQTKEANFQSSCENMNSSNTGDTGTSIMI